MTAARTTRPRPAGRRRATAAALVGVVLAAPLLAGCSDDEPDPEATASADAASASARAEELADAPAAERLQAVVDALPDMTRDTYDQVGVVPELPEGVLPADLVAADVASFGSDDTGWFVLERRDGTVADNDAAVAARLTAAGYVEGAEVDPEGMPVLQVFERAEDGSVVGVYVSDVTGQAADAEEFPTRVGYLVTPEVGR